MVKQHIYSIFLVRKRKQESTRQRPTYLLDDIYAFLITIALLIPVADRARPEAWPAAAIVRSRVCARTICIVLYCMWYCMWLALLTSV